ncbi:NEAT domain-containing protein [Mammaliicoccus sciuri]|nr:NEAT domain-containing protein [Mammaliicoccus sciuri]
MESKTIDFVVNKDKSNEISYMDQYMVKPAKVYFENGETYVEMTLKSASIGSHLNCMMNQAQLPFKQLKKIIKLIQKS